ncbi:MAG TPA: hypothetical protein PLP19_05670, partial [bacterium]|nr:hypothetical protein [bacterium]HPN42955.1 hypothetical protein [bacterium]
MKRLFLFMMILAMAMAVGAKTVYVDGDTGSDSNSGLYPSAAMGTFDNALDLCSPGDVIVMYNYQENLADA